MYGGMGSLCGGSTAASPRWDGELVKRQVRSLPSTLRHRLASGLALLLYVDTLPLEHRQQRL